MYWLLQMILEYFPAFGRSLHCVKISEKASSFVEFEHARNEPPSCILNVGRPSEPVL